MTRPHRHGSAERWQLADTIFTRLAIALEVMVDMRGWGRGRMQGITPLA
jgi:hypothetical protein